jgi:hypothetical protein
MYKIYRFLLNIAVLFLTSFCGFASDIPDTPPDGYLRQNYYKAENVRKGFSKDLYCETEQMAAQMAADHALASYKHWFDDNVVEIMLRKIKDFGFQIGKEERVLLLDRILRDRIPYVLHHGQVKIRLSEDFTLPYSIDDETFFIKFNLETDQDFSLSSKMSFSLSDKMFFCYYYELQAKVDWSMEWKREQ